MLTRLLMASRPSVLSSLASQPARCFSATSSNAGKTLLFLEQKAGQLAPSTLNAITAAKAVGGEVDGVILGAEGEGGVGAKFGLGTVYHRHSAGLAHTLAEEAAPALVKLIKDGGYTHVVAAHTAVGKNVFPRVAALLDVQQISDVMSLKGEDTFVRPIYAGNAIQTIKSADGVKVFTIRTSNWEPATEDGGESKVDAAAAESADSAATWVSESLTKSERPDLGSASTVVSGGRGLKSKDNFDSLIVPLADSIGAAVGASRAAVDSGFADNSLQVGQTGKIVAPSLYVAVGISGAIQHLAGMKDSKLIVAINKDADAPIFQVADAGLVADLFEAVPELTKKLEALEK